LHQRQDFKHFVEGSKSARAKNVSTGVKRQGHFAGKKVFKSVVFGGEIVECLLGWQIDI
jgi:hypothetical protein